jgi:endogenous inhibitor of DNA gyrase (YacG/DUF329 family)
MPITVPCPTCKNTVELGSKWFPFCSDRCRLIDIGRWHDEEYRIPATTPPAGAPAPQENGSGDDEE